MILAPSSSRLPGKPDGEDRAPGGAVGRGNPAAVGIDNAAADGQTESQARILRAHVGFEDLIGRFRGDPRSVVGDRDGDPVAAGGGYADGAAVGQGVEGIEHQVEKHLAELLVVGLDHQGLRRKLAADRHPLATGTGGNQLQGLVEDLANVGPPLLQPRRAGEIEEGLQRSIEPRGLVGNHGQIAAAKARLGPRLDRRLHQQLQRRQRVAQLVGQAGGKLAQGRHLLRAEDLVLASVASGPRPFPRGPPCSAGFRRGVRFPGRGQYRPGR